MYNDGLFTLGVDIGGSHVSSAMVDPTGRIFAGSYFTKQIDASLGAHQIAGEWTAVMKASLSSSNIKQSYGVGISIPGPFNYAGGISLMDGLGKFQRLFGVDVGQLIRDRLNLPDASPIVFENDAACFGLGESFLEAAGYEKIIAVTLGTGFGSSFIRRNTLIKKGVGVPANGYLYDTPFGKGIAEDYISSRWIVQEYARLSGADCTVRDIALQAKKGNDKIAWRVFWTFGRNLAACLRPWIGSFRPGCIVIGGGISRSAELFLPAVQEELGKWGISLPVKVSSQMEVSSIRGVSTLLDQGMFTQPESSLRKSGQPLMPLTANAEEGSTYELYPSYRMPAESIHTGYASLAKWMVFQRTVVIDGFEGNDWVQIRRRLSQALRELDVCPVWYDASACAKTEDVVDNMVRPFLGEAHSVWGKRTTLGMGDFFEQAAFDKIIPGGLGQLSILIGTGACLAGWPSPVVYIDLPKNEVQYRMRAERATNLGSSRRPEYKRAYFVDWPVLNDHRKAIRNSISLVADGQWLEDITWVYRRDLDMGLEGLTHSLIRARPWFEPGAWGGQWMKDRIKGLNKNEVNYAWSFELITPENGVVFDDGRHRLEVAFDWLMEFDHKAVLGKDADRFGEEFPIRFDFLDTFDGGNLSIQCHPGTHYIQEQFGERITQDETYYILDCKEDAGVYLGFHENIDPVKFREDLECSLREGKVLDIAEYVQSLPSRKHDLFLIPNKTIHGSGANNLVLEISSTPYIFTFKMYDWQRLDLNGKPRPINIGHAFENLDFDRKGRKVKEELVSTPVVLEENDHYKIEHLPTHPVHFYDVHRIGITDEIRVRTNDQCHILMLVEGESIEVEAANGYRKTFAYAETFVVPAAAGSYRMVNRGGGKALVIKAFIK